MFISVGRPPTVLLVYMLRLRKCKLCELEGVPECDVVDASFNYLKGVDLGVLGARSVLLAYNDLEEVEVSRVNTRIQHLDLSHNRMTRLSDAFFERLPSLTTLKLQGNMLSALPEGIGRCKNLASLNLGDDLGGNNLNTFPALPASVATLSACNNRLTKLPPMHSDIESLDLRNNRLTELPFMEGARRLLVTGNPISLTDKDYSVRTGTCFVDILKDPCATQSSLLALCLGRISVCPLPHLEHK
jgi:hypothetical protein